MDLEINKSRGFEKLNLSSDETSKLKVVMKKAQEFEINEEKELMRQPLEGQLNKYTNVVKGWQHRWFVLNTDQGRLDYFEKEEHKKLLKPSRGSIILAGAVVCPSDEDSQTFIINAVNGEVFRLKASDARERQHWVNRLRATAEFHFDLSYGKSPNHQLTRNNNSFNNCNNNNNNNNFEKLQLTQTQLNKPINKHTPSNKSNNIYQSIHSSTQQLNNVSKLSQRLHMLIEDSPNGIGISSLDQDLLMLKAASKSALCCLQHCHAVISQQASLQPFSSPLQGELISANELNESLETRNTTIFSHSSTSHTHLIQQLEREQLRQRYEDAEQDKHTYTETDLISVDDHKPVILELLSQLKLGMDLTKVVLPTFILERRSLLEMFADCMAHPDFFMRITESATAEERMLRVVEWYLTSFHAARHGAIAKKPYNPIIGETFHCLWSCEPSVGVDVGENVNSKEKEDLKEKGDAKEVKENVGKDKLFYCAEQVSHHPPISAFYFEAPKQGISMQTSIWTRSKFMGMSVGVVMVGKIHLKLHNIDGAPEEYIFTLPSAYARSILTTPWMELGDKISISCLSTKHSASITFHTKPFYGGRLHRVSAEVKNAGGEFVCHVTGEWNGVLDFNFTNGSTRSIDTSILTIHPKQLAPINTQKSHESRKLWHKVTEHLRQGDVESASQHKHLLEQQQRQLEKQRLESHIPIQLKYFEQTSDEWIFKYPLSATTPPNSFISAFL